MDNKKEQLKNALKYADRGYSVIPVQKDKKPFVKWSKFQKEKATPEQIRQWWSDFPGANIGIVTGEISGLTILDPDTKSGIDALNDLLPENLTTPVANTPNGGQHYYFKYVPDLPNKARVLTDTDIRNDGGYIVAVPGENGNGKKYAWVDGLSLSDVVPAQMPEKLSRTIASSSEHINKGIKDKSPYRGNQQNQQNQAQQIESNRINRIKSFDKGQRDESIFHAGICLKKGGMEDDKLLECLQIIGLGCNPPFPEKEIYEKYKSVLKRSKKRKKGLTERVRKFVIESWGIFSVAEAYQIESKESFVDRIQLRTILGRLVVEGLIERIPDRNGWYRRIADDCEAEDWQNTSTETVNIWLPFELNEMIEIMPGSIILIAGSQDAGKSAAMMNIAKENMDKWNTHYFSSELNAGAFKMRTAKFPYTSPDQWKSLKFYQRSDNFHDVIKTGKNDLNLIDYMEVHKDFWGVGGYLAEIHKKLGKGICIVALQKDPYATHGRGGSFNQEKPILSLSIDYGKVSITKFKGQFKGENPRGKEYRFKIIDGCQFIQGSGWHKPLAIDTK